MQIASRNSCFRAYPIALIGTAESQEDDLSPSLLRAVVRVCSISQVNCRGIGECFLLGLPFSTSHGNDMLMIHGVAVKLLLVDFCES